jgi:uncharacterized protein
MRPAIAWEKRSHFPSLTKLIPHKLAAMMVSIVRIVVEHNGDFYSCDHFVDADHRIGNIIETPLAELLESPGQLAFGQAQRKTLLRFCRECEVLAMCHGECPKNRFLRTPDGGRGLDYLSAGYKRFFNHCRPFVDEMAAAWKRQGMKTG